AAERGGWSKKGLDLTPRGGDFYEVVKKKLKGDEVALDIGTAEGNNFLRLAPCFKKGIGIDIEPEMINLAQKNKKRYGAKNVIFKCMDAKKLKFPADSFDIITVKHSPLFFKEACRVLKPGGLLITQQVHETDKLNLKQAFGRGQGYKEKPGSLLKRYKKQARQAGFKQIKSEISNIPHYFIYKRELIRFLDKAPTIPDFGGKKDYFILEKFIQKNKTPRGIKSNTSRFLLEVKK
ncbi:MAG: methyltransferase domain-containing protein, partial [Patescibacteria group bacterium]|nr:methyltransferase domain-containing protein [Patescibacteria group bacterium]